MKEPVDHILRPRLPWRDDEAALTECGFDALKVKTLSRTEFFQRFKDYGRQRTALMTCMTCSDTASRWKSWDDDPRQAMDREIAWEYRARMDRGERLKDELIPISFLVEKHRTEFGELIKANEQRRSWLEKKADHAKKPKTTKGLGL